jgi:hypothetical protein
MSEEKQIVATLVMKAGGMARQRIQLSGRRNLDFVYRRGVGHVREYTDLEEFHKEEAALREIARLPFNIRTVLGAVDDHTRVKGALKAMIADDSGHRPTKHAKLAELRSLLDAEIARLERAGVGREPERTEASAAPQPSAREMEIERRRSYLRRAGEEETRKIARDYGLQVPKLNNYQGMMDAIIAREFPEGEGGLKRRGAEDAEEASGGTAQACAAPPQGGADLFAMPIKDLNALAKQHGIKARARNAIIEALGGGMTKSE